MPIDVKVEEEMLMHKLYELMSAEGLIKKVHSVAILLCCRQLYTRVESMCYKHGWTFLFHFL